MKLAVSLDSAVSIKQGCTSSTFSSQGHGCLWLDSKPGSHVLTYDAHRICSRPPSSWGLPGRKLWRHSEVPGGHIINTRVLLTGFLRLVSWTASIQHNTENMTPEKPAPISTLEVNQYYCYMCVHKCMCHSLSMEVKEPFVECPLLLSFCSGNWTQVTELLWQVPLSDELSHRPPTDFHYHSKFSFGSILKCL